jgi:hypothetical protein
VLYVDETSVSKYLHQLFTIYGLVNGHFLPLVIFLLANKHQTLCENVFRYTVSGAAKLGVNFCPAVVYSDIDIAIHNTVTTVVGL